MTRTALPTYTTAQICQHVSGQLEGPDDLKIEGVEGLVQAVPGQVTFIADERFADQWAASKASAALVKQDVAVPTDPARAVIRVPDADLAVAAVLELFAPPPPHVEAGTHASAVVDPSCELGPGVSIGANCFVGRQARIGRDTVLHANVTILDEVQIADGCVLWPGVVVRERCVIGDHCILHPNVTIGADGFGYRPAPNGQGLVKIPHIGTVQIGAEVEIGAGTCVDRGKFSATSIGDGTKIDNLCQIAHNCRIGRCCILAGQLGLAGSVTVGDGTVMGGQVAIKEHITIGAGATLAACSAVMNDVPPGQSWGGIPAQERRSAIRERAALRQIPQLVRALKKQGGAGLGGADRP